LTLTHEEMGQTSFVLFAFLAASAVALGILVYLVSLVFVAPPP
jgi:hypothetical protein